LPCNVEKDCAAGTICVSKSSPKLFGMQLQSAFTGVCLFLDPASHHNFDSPYGKEITDHLKCKETAADGVEIKEFITTDNKKASICAPKAS